MKPTNTSENHLAEIERELRVVKKVMKREIIRYETVLEPNPELGVCEATFHKTTGDRQHIIVKKPIYGDVEKEVPDEKRVYAAAEKLTALVFGDESWIDRAQKLMPSGQLFRPYWEQIYDQAVQQRTRQIAARKLQCRTRDKVIQIVRQIMQKLGPPAQKVGYTVLGVIFYAGLITFIWPKSSLGQWIAKVGKQAWHFITGLF